MPYQTTIERTRWTFSDLKTLLAKASPARSGDALAGIAASSAIERVAAQMTLADLPLKTFLNADLVPYEEDEVTRLIQDSHDASAFAGVSHLTVGGFREWLLDQRTTAGHLSALAPGLTPEMAAAVSKIMRLQDLVTVAAKCSVVTAFRNTIGLPGRLATRLQPNHPTDDSRGHRRKRDGRPNVRRRRRRDRGQSGDRRTQGLFAHRHFAGRYQDATSALPPKPVVLAHVTTAIKAIELGAPVDLVFQSIAGSEKANRGFGIDLSLLGEAREAALSLGRGDVGANVTYFETGQGSALSADAHFGVDQQTMEARAYAVARKFQPLLVNTVVGFIGPEYLYDGKQIMRAGLEDHFCGKLLGLPMGCDVCYTNHAEADQDDMDALLTVLSAAGVAFVIAVPGADDVMLNYQSLSFHDILYVRQTLGRRCAPEFEDWLLTQGIAGPDAPLLERPAGAMARTMALIDSLDAQ